MTEGMAWIAGGAFLMGSNEFYPEERPAHRVAVAGFWIDRYPVTNGEFGRFVEATGYVTVAERVPDPADYPGIDVEVLVPGSLVFVAPERPVRRMDPRLWWRYVPGACWKYPEGPGSDVRGRERHPVVHVSFEDARAYAAWANKALPTEAEWEFAARGGLEGATFVWGAEFMPGGRRMAKTWEGVFPWRNLAQEGWERTAPVGAFAANGYGLYDMAGNVWEWTEDVYEPGHRARKQSCCTLMMRKMSGAEPSELVQRVVKGGSHLCSAEYCFRFRPAARQGESVDTSTGHIGFRCVVRPDVVDREKEGGKGAL